MGPRKWAVRRGAVSVPRVVCTHLSEMSLKALRITLGDPGEHCFSGRSGAGLKRRCFGGAEPCRVVEYHRSGMRAETMSFALRPGGNLLPPLYMTLGKASQFSESSFPHLRK